MTEKKDTTRNPAADTLADATITAAEKGSADAMLSERTEELLVGGMKILQSEKYYRFTSDSVLLSRFARCKAGEVAADFCAGSGIVGLHFYALHQGMVACVTCFEMQKELADMNRRSVALNGLEEKIQIVEGDIREASQIFGAASFDVVTSNPPYMNDAHGLKNPDLPKAIARHEVLCTLDDVVREASRVLKTGGRFYMVHRPHRLAEIITVLRGYKLEPKRMKMVHPFADRDANMVLIEAVKGGGVFLKMEAPVIVFKEPGVYADEIRDVYGY